MPIENRDDAITLVGKLLYRSDWIEITEAEWKLRDEFLPASPRKASTIARARSRWATFDRQQGDVLHWLQGTHRLDMSKKGFDPEAFAKFFKENFDGIPLTPTLARQAAVAARLRAGERPGRGGNVRWKTFCDSIRADCRARFDDKTIVRDVNDLLQDI